jgi:ElaB/YqjD/DUF883 family membrane-anchored ribosome-binding protein
MFDDLHDGVEALRTMARTNSNGLSEEATESLQRLENTEPPASKFKIWKEAIKGRAVKAAHRTDAVVHAHPYTSVLSALAIGILIGFSLASLTDNEEETEEFS